jgi:hypothetical protein
MTEGPDQSQYIPRHYSRPWDALVSGVTPFDGEQVENLRRNEHALETEGSEFSHGPGIEPPFVTPRANREHRYATPGEGGAYHGKAPRLPSPIIACGRHRPNRPT